MHAAEVEVVVILRDLRGHGLLALAAAAAYAGERCKRALYEACEGIRRVFLAAQRQSAAVRCVCVSQVAAITLSSCSFTHSKVEAAMLVCLYGASCERTRKTACMGKLSAVE